MIVIADPDAGFRSRVADALEDRDGLAFVENGDELQTLVGVRSDDVDVVLVGPGMPATSAFRLAERMRAAAAPTSVVLLTAPVTPELLREAIRAGVRDVLADAFELDELRDAVDGALLYARQMRRRSGVPEPDGPETSGKVVTVFSSKGGCGKSVVACNLAILLAKAAGENVALVDLDLESGDLAIMLQVLPALSLFDAAEKADRLDTQALGGYLSRHDAGVDLLAAPPEPSLAGAVSGESVRTILGLLRASHPYTVVDGPSSFTDQLLAGLDATDELVLVTTLDVPSVKNLKLALQTLDQLGWERDRIRLVLNRADSQVGLRVKDVERTLGTTIDVHIPSNRDVPLSVNEGEPVAARRPRSPVVAAVAELAAQLQGSAVTGQEPGAAAADPGLFRRLIGRHA